MALSTYEENKLRLFLKKGLSFLGFAEVDLPPSNGSGGVSDAAQLTGTLNAAQLPATAVQTAAAQTLTNKTISGANNTLTNIAPSSLTGLSAIATSGAYADLLGKPSLFDGAYASLSGKPTLFDGTYASLSGKPTIPTAVSTLTNDSGYQTAAQVGKLTINSYTSSATAILADQNNLVLMNVASANNYTVPPNSSVAFEVGRSINVVQTGAGQTTLVAGAGVTINSAGGALKARVAFSSITLIKTATDTWLAVGDLTN